MLRKNDSKRLKFMVNPPLSARADIVQSRMQMQSGSEGEEKCSEEKEITHVREERRIALGVSINGNRGRTGVRAGELCSDRLERPGVEEIGVPFGPSGLFLNQLGDSVRANSPMPMKPPKTF